MTYSIGQLNQMLINASTVLNGLQDMRASAWERCAQQDGYSQDVMDAVDAMYDKKIDSVCDDMDLIERAIKSVRGKTPTDYIRKREPEQITLTSAELEHLNAIAIAYMVWEFD